MSFPGTLNAIRAADSFSIDSFNRWRISSQKLRLSAIFDTDLRPLYWDTALTAGGTAALIANQPAVAMTVNAAGDIVVRQTREYFVYRTGQAQLLIASFIFETLEASLTQEVGYHDTNNGMLFRATGTTLEVVQRSFTSGAPVDIAVAQAAWNLDTLDGTGASEITLDVTRTQILVIDFQALFSGRVRFGFDIDGMIVYCHEFNNANSLTVPYVTTAKLPVRYRIEATGAIGGARVMTQICAAVFREGGSEEPDTQRSADSGEADTAVGTDWETVVGVRLAAANIRATIRPALGCVLNTDAVDPLEWALVLNPAGVGAATFGFTLANSVAVVSRNNIAVTIDASGDLNGGTVLSCGFAAAAQGGRGGPREISVDETLPVAADIAGTPDELWLIARGIGAASTLRAGLVWKETR